MIYKAFGVLLLAMTLLLTNRAIAGGGGTQTTQTTLNLGIVTTNPFSACVTYLSAEHCVNLTFSATGAFSDEHTFTYSIGSENEVWEVTFTGTYAIPGYVDTKFMVVGVTYAPPGSSTNTFVSYGSSSLVGNTMSLSNSFGTSITSSADSSSGYAVAVSKGSITNTTSTTTAQTSKTTSTITTSVQVQNGEKTFGTSNYFAPVNHDYDTVWVWLNAAVLFDVTSTSVTWLGYGYDTTDQPNPDIVPIELGYLNGDFGPIPPDIQTSINRSWAASQTFRPGDGPALTAADLAQIAAADPFSVSTYGTSYIGSSPPSPQTADSRFTLSACSSNGSSDPSFNYIQAAPSQGAAVDTCTLTYSNLSTTSQDITNSYSQTFSVDESISATFYAAISNDLKTAYTLTWTTEAQSSITNTTSSTAMLSVQGPPCNNTSAGVGPCVPVYDSAGGQPVQFEVYQDNLYGTFMFAPINFY